MEKQAKYTAKKKSADKVIQVIEHKQKLLKELQELQNKEKNITKNAFDDINKKLERDGFEIAYRIERKDVFVVISQLLEAFKDPRTNQVDLKGNVILIPKVENGTA